MKKEFLSEYIVDVAAKRLSAAEADCDSSYYYKFNGDAQLETLLGKEKLIDQQICTQWLSGEEDSDYFESSYFTWYGACERHSTRSEYRLYVKADLAMGCVSAGDLLVIARRPSGELRMVAAAEGSAEGNQLTWLFGLSNCTDTNFMYRNIEIDGDHEVGFAVSSILEELCIELKEHDLDELEEAALCSLLIKFHERS